VFGISALTAKRRIDPLAVTKAYTQLGEALGLDWAQQEVSRFSPKDQWERLLVAGLERDFEQLRLDFLGRSREDDPDQAVIRWSEHNSARIAQFRRMVDTARSSGAATAPMLAQIASQARILLGR